MFLTRCFLAAFWLLPAAHSQNTPIFDFHSGFWVNLHHFLYEQAMNASAAADAPEWRHALDYYRANLVKQDQLGREMEAINNALSDRESAPSLEGYERSWMGALPVFEKDWKPYLDGKGDRATAVHRVVEDYSVPAK